MKSRRRTQKLDTILNYSAQFKDMQIPLKDLYNHLQINYPGFTGADITQALNKLLIDHNISGTDPGYYKITLKGVVFLEDGGYLAQKQNKLVKSRYQNYIKKYETENSPLFPWILALAGILIVAGVLRMGFLYYHWSIPF